MGLLKISRGVVIITVAISSMRSNILEASGAVEVRDRMVGAYGRYQLSVLDDGNGQTSIA